ncbi:AI-2E family transporter [Roseisalinus antarcticus]|uniref:Pheromone autoinducer 2 transporter n=1 Tax=Roseisalinus antarcticus TaxID=254357 RepID=A0A1Y5SUQ8_9RHOB|nr:AI-2E family transporter [Roseisalinus antarcticus]SLN47435.1 pheromone autoinducer 2 transporter [Roseisalinus antarcticus]
MALPVREQAIHWGIAMAVFLLAMWYLGDVLTPFVLGGAFAYILDPVADRLERLGLSRTLSVAAIGLVALMLFVLMALLVVPLMIQQAAQFVNTVPELFGQLRDWLATRFPDVMTEGSTIRTQLQTIGEALQSSGGKLLNSALSSALGVINILFLLFIVPVVTFYLLLDWDRMVAKVDDLLPRDHAPTIRLIASDIDATLSSFIRGQGLVMAIQGTFYAIGLMAVGLQFGLFVGALSGLISFIPYVGAIVGGSLAVGLALFQFWGDWWMVVAVAAIFFGGQFLEGNILTPKLVGDSVGLHPVWLILALSVFGTLFGFIGLLLAVPVSAALGVVARFFIAQYKHGLLYRGLERPSSGDDDGTGPGAVAIRPGRTGGDGQGAVPDPAGRRGAAGGESTSGAAGSESTSGAAGSGDT